MKTTRRTLNFANESEAVAEAARLLAGGYSKLGQWSLGQNCEHVARMIDSSLDGFPMKGPWIMRKIIGPWIAPFLLRRDGMPAGLPAPSAFVPHEDAHDSESVAKLRASFERFANHTGPLHPSPMLGPLTKQQWQRLHLVHAAHHLGFLIPTKN